MRNNKYLVTVHWNLDLPAGLGMLEVLKPKTIKTFVLEAREQPSLVVIQKISRIKFEDYDNNGFQVQSITLLEPKQAIKEYDKVDEDITEDEI